MYGIYYIMFATFADLFSSVYHFDTSMGGLAYIGLGLGFFVAAWFGARISDKIYNRVRITSNIFGNMRNFDVRVLNS